MIEKKNNNRKVKTYFRQNYCHLRGRIKGGLVVLGRVTGEQQNPFPPWSYSTLRAILSTCFVQILRHSICQGLVPLISIPKRLYIVKNVQ